MESEKVRMIIGVLEIGQFSNKIIFVNRLQFYFIISIIFCVQNSCFTHSALLTKPPKDVQNLNKNSNVHKNETHNSIKVWPSNLKHFDIWNTIEIRRDGIDGVADKEDADLLLPQTIKNFQYVGNNLDEEFLSSVSNSAVDVPEETDGLDLNQTNDKQKLNDKQRHDAATNITEKYFGNKTILERLNYRKNRVIHLFPVPVDGECLSDDGRRTGSCFNIYECRAKGGLAKGDCAMGFGVCCIFIAECNTTITNNITYLVSPKFPSFMPNNYSAPCNFKIELMGNDVSQLRIDFYHFSLGQPNRRNGVCDGDVFTVSGGPSGNLTLCGQNSGQHIYYEVGGSAVPRQTLYGNLRPLTFSQLFPNISGSAMPVIEISMNFSQRFQPIRLWEIRIAQIPFSQRAPVGCLQYNTGTEGIVQTFNFAENGRHLANQNYRICMRQEQNMCSIMYEPCDEQSFRIGASMSGEPGVLNMGPPIMMMDPMLAGVMNGMVGANGGANGGAGGAGVGAADSPTMDAMPTMQQPVLADDPDMLQTMDTTTTTMISSSASSEAATTSTTAATMVSSMSSAADSSAATMATEAASSSSAAPASSTQMSSAAPTSSDPPAPSSEAPASSSSATTLNIRSSTTPTTPISSSTLSDEITEGSGGGDSDWVAGSPTRRPGTVSGGFDLFGFLRSALDFTAERSSSEQKAKFNKHSASESTRPSQSRQLYSRCTDRITMPCIVEDFIGMGPLGSSTLPGCEPVHCGSQFCSSGVWPCRIESTVTPFYIGVHFGSGSGKGSAEDNIGACLRYQQVECM